ncbi:hypothetical protein D3C81_547660 [compost metagenome]
MTGFYQYDFQPANGERFNESALPAVYAARSKRVFPYREGALFFFSRSSLTGYDFFAVS